MFYPIQLDKMRNFRYGMKALSLVEKKLKTPVSKIDMNSMTMEDSAALIWAGLVHEDRDLTPDKVMDLVDEFSSLPNIMASMSEALQGAFGTANSEEIEEKNAQEITSLK